MTVTTLTPSAPPFWTVVVARLSALSEPAVLMWFWGLLHDMAEATGFSDCDPQFRLGLLLLMGQVVITRPETWDFGAVRDAHGTQRYRFGPNRTCFVCHTGRKVYFHHIIEVQNGGDNVFRNQVALCFACHQYLHPWLVEQGARWDFVQLGSVLDAVSQDLFGGGGGTGTTRGVRDPVVSPIRRRRENPFDEIHRMIHEDARVQSQRVRRTEDIE